MLNAYLAATNQLLQNPVSNPPLYTTANLTIFVNQARQQLAGETGCVRVTAHAVLASGVQVNPFSIFAASLNVTGTGVESVLTLRQLAVTSPGASNPTLITARPWEWFSFYNLYTGETAAQSTGTPDTWAQQGRGTSGTFGVSNVPNATISATADTVCLPTNLVDDTTPEAIPVPFTTAIPYYSAYLAYLSSQRRDDATVMFNRYLTFVQRAIQESTSEVLPVNQPNGIGAQIVSGKQALTGPAGGGQGGR